MSVTNSIPRSIEVEYWVVDSDGRLTDAKELVDETPGIEQEFVDPLLEIKTSPCETTVELRTELFDRLETALRRADERDRKLVPLGTPIVDEGIEEQPSDRTRIQNEIIGEAFGYVRHCAGTHIHVERQAGSEVDQFNTLTALDPALALLNSSPYFRGRRLATGARSKLYRRMAYEDVPHQGWLWRYLDDVDEWDRRLERRYDDFLTAAIDAGVDRRAFEAAFDPESAVWTPVQLRTSFPTVEWRSPDAALPSQILRLADTVTETVGLLDDAEVRIEGDTGKVTEESIILPEFDVVIQHVDAAIEDGLASSAVRSYLERMGFDVTAYEPIAAEFDGSEPITASEGRRLRLEYADRLEADVRREQSIETD